MHTEEIARETKTYRRTMYLAIDPTQPELSIKDKSPVVTNAAQGMGASIARSGISALELMDRRPGPPTPVAEEIAKIVPNTKIFTYQVDIVDEEAVNADFAAFSVSIVDTLQLTSWSPTARYITDRGTIANVDAKNWWSGFEINVQGNFYLLRVCHRLAPEDGQGAVIHVSSWSSSMHGPYMSDFSSDRASKADATKLFEIFSEENPAFFVLQIHPGLVGGTNMHSKFAHTTGGFEFDDV